MTKSSIVIVNYNGKSFIEECLTSVAEQDGANSEIIFVDNSSADDSLQRLENLLAQQPKLKHVLRVCKLGENFGFAGGNCHGLKMARGEYLVTLNIDTRVETNWLSQLLEVMDVDGDIGVASSKLISHGSHTIDSAGDGFSTALKGFKRGEGGDLGQYINKGYVLGACAGAALYRREMLNEIGFFDEDFFLIYEDTDLNLRAQLAGWKVVYVPTAVVHHEVRSSIGTMSETAVYYSLRNSEWVRIKNVPLGVFLVCLPEFFVGAVSEFFYFAVKHGFFKLYFRAKWDALKGFPKMYRKRKEIMKLKRVSNRYLLSMMTPLWNKEFFLSKSRKFLHD